MAIINRLDRVSARVEQGLAVLAGGALILMMLHICLDATVRVLWDSQALRTLTIVSAWYMVAIVFLAMPYVGRNPGHIRVELATQHFPRVVRRVLDGIVFAVSAVYCAFIAWVTFQEALAQTRSGEVWDSAGSYIAVWPSRWILPATFAVLAGLFMLRALRPRAVAERSPAPENERL